MARALLLAALLANSARAWEDCSFPRAAWFVLDESVGISYAYAVAAMNGNLYSGGYTKGNFAFVGVNNTHDINPEACATLWGSTTEDVQNLYVAEVSEAGKMTMAWHFLGSAIQVGVIGHGPQTNSINAASGLHKMLDNQHVAVAGGFKQLLTLPDGTVWSSACASGTTDRCDNRPNQTISQRAFVIKLDVSKEQGIGAGTTGWAKQMDTEYAGGASVYSVDGDVNGNMIVSWRGITYDPADNSLTGRYYLTKLAAADGTVVWQKVVAMPLYSCRTVTAGDVFCGFSIQKEYGFVEFGDGVSINATAFDGMVGILKVNSAGMMQWAKATFEASFGDLSVSKSGNLLAAVGSRKVARIDVSSGKEGDLIWLDTSSGLGSHGFRGVEVMDDETDVVVFGQVTEAGGDLVLTDVDGDTTTLRSRGSYDVYVAFFNATDGKGKFATDGGGNGMEYFFAFAKDSETKAVYIGGTSRSQKMHWGNITRDNVMQPEGVSSSTPVGSSKAFVIKMESTLEKPYCVSTCKNDRPMVAADVMAGYCYIDRHCYVDGEYPEYATASCRKCEATVNPLEWSEPDLTENCFIDGRCFESGAGMPYRSGWRTYESTCEVCDPTKSSSGWSLVPGYEVVSQPYTCKELSWQEEARSNGWAPCKNAVAAVTTRLRKLKEVVVDSMSGWTRPGSEDDD